MSDFETFWKSKTIPARMKRCGPKPVRDALTKRGMMNEEGFQQILDSIPGYVKHKPDYADFCMLSTYINQERDLVPWDEMEEPQSDVQFMSYEERREYSRRLIAEQSKNVVKIRG